jgi:hypothetical protein
MKPATSGARYLRTMRAATLAVAVLAPAAAHAVGDPSAPPLSAWDTAIVERLRVRAGERLRQVECQRLLDDFSDVAGRSLRSRLEQSGRTAGEQLEAMRFVSGAQSRHCREATHVLMLAQAGRPVVQVCPAAGRTASRLTLMEFETPQLAEFALIHEMLHTLGLGENPPTSQQITQAVKRRCHGGAGRAADGREARAGAP